MITLFTILNLTTSPSFRRLVLLLTQYFDIYYLNVTIQSECMSITDIQVDKQGHITAIKLEKNLKMHSRHEVDIIMMTICNDYRYALFKEGGGSI